MVLSTTVKLVLSALVVMFIFSVTGSIYAGVFDEDIKISFSAYSTLEEAQYVINNLATGQTAQVYMNVPDGYVFFTKQKEMPPWSEQDLNTIPSFCRKESCICILLESSKKEIECLEVNAECVIGLASENENIYGATLTGQRGPDVQIIESRLVAFQRDVCDKGSAILISLPKPTSSV